MKQIPLTQGKFAFVDDEDYEWLSQWKWYAAKDHHTYYALRMIRHENGKRSTVPMHRQILNAGSGTYVDHKNLDGLDNQKKNIRACTCAENRRNSRTKAGKTSKYKGVYWCKTPQKWHAQIKVNYQHRHLGYFYSEDDAARAYDRAAIELFGEFAATNEKLGLLPKAI